MSEQSFYTYLYLDPRKQGNFHYGAFSFDFEPFYVGKGFNNRHISHLREAINTPRNNYKLNKIRAILNLNLRPIIIKVIEDVSEKEAFDMEVELIRSIGRHDLDLGSLTNMTDGGDGINGLVRTKEHQKKIADSNRGQTRTEETKQLMSESQKVYFSDEKNRVKKSDVLVGYYSSEEGQETKQQISSTLISFYDTEEGQQLKEHLSSINIGENNPLYGTKNSEETIQKRIDTRQKNGYWQKDKEVLSESFSNGQKKRFSDPVERRKQSERVKGKRWYNNGEQQGQYHPDKKPDGWELGRLR